MHVDEHFGNRRGAAADAPRIGVLALQGSFAEHIELLRFLDVSTVRVDRPEQVDTLEGLIIPGGESTTLAHLMNASGLTQAVLAATQRGLAVYGSCAGLVLLSKQPDGTVGKSLNLLDIEVSRNWYGRQINSFDLDLDIAGIDGPPFRAIFIRAPAIRNVGVNVEVLAKLPDGTPVAVRAGRHLATAFHPELAGDPRFHRFFIEMARTARDHVSDQRAPLDVLHNRAVSQGGFAESSAAPGNDTDLPVDLSTR